MACRWSMERQESTARNTGQMGVQCLCLKLGQHPLRLRHRASPRSSPRDRSATSTPTPSLCVGLLLPRIKTQWVSWHGHTLDCIILSSICENEAKPSQKYLTTKFFFLFYYWNVLIDCHVACGSCPLTNPALFKIQLSSGETRTLPRSSSMAAGLEKNGRSRVQAIFSHAAGDNSTLLSFSEGDVITLLVPEARDGWHYGENEKNKMYV